MDKIFELLGEKLTLDEQEEAILAILAYAVAKLRPDLNGFQKADLVFELRSEM